MELIKQIVKVGNSAGVILPREWLNGKARIELISKPLNIKKEIFEILEEYLEDIEGIYIVGSYARREENEKSDIDIFVITNKINKKIIKGSYEIILISKRQLEKTLERNILPLLPMIKEAKVIMNKELLSKYRNYKLNKSNLKFYFDVTTSAMKVCKSAINIDKESGAKNTSDAIAYSLILNLRSTYLVDSLIKNKKWSTKDFLRLIKKISNSLESYEGYTRVKSDIKSKRKLEVEDARKLISYILEKLDEHKKLLKKTR